MPKVSRYAGCHCKQCHCKGGDLYYLVLLDEVQLEHFHVGEYGRTVLTLPSAFVLGLTGEHTKLAVNQT